MTLPGPFLVRATVAGGDVARAEVRPLALTWSPYQ